MLHAPAEEVAALFAITPKQLERWIKAGYFPPYVAIHFAGLERAYFAARVGSDPEPVINPGE